MSTVVAPRYIKGKIVIGISGAEYAVNFLPKVRLEVAVPTDLAALAVEAIGTAAKTGQIGDGKIFVAPIEQAVRIRTGETDADAL